VRLDIFFQDPTAIPLPPSEVRVKDLRAAPWQDNRRVGVYLEVTPFQRKPNAELTITNPSGEVVAQASIIETMITKMELTLHLRGPLVSGSYTLSVTIFYVQTPQGEADDPRNFTDPSRRQVVDKAQTVFEIHSAPG
jgi:hypothetical protein